MENELILVDVDGVLLNWLGSFRTWLEDKGYKVKYPEHLNTYHFMSAYGIERPLSGELCDEFNSSSYISELEPINGAVETVKKLHDNHGHRFVAITSFSKNPVSHTFRKMNLYEVFGDVFDDFIFLDHRESKLPSLKKYQGTGYAWIDDTFVHVWDGFSVGLNAILFDHPYNSDFYFTDEEIMVSKHIPRINGWDNVYNYLKGDINGKANPLYSVA